MRLIWRTLLVIVAVTVVVGLLSLLLVYHLRSVPLFTPAPAGLLVGNDGREPIKEVTVTYPGGQYTIHDLAYHETNERRDVLLRGEPIVTLDITYAHGRQVRRVVQLPFLKTPQLIQLIIDDNADVRVI